MFEEFNPRSSPEGAERRICAAPRTPTERWLHDLWMDVLRAPELGLHDGFFESGGHSALAIRLFSRIERELGRTIPPSALFQSPTVALLADRIDEEEIIAPDVVIPLWSRSDSAPLVFVPGVEGHVFEYRDAARQLGGARSVYGLQTHNLFGNGLALASVESLAETCLDELRAAGVNGPMHLVGQGFGGLVAWEMACRLTRRRRPVAFLGLLDTDSSGTPRRASLVRFRNGLRAWRDRIAARRHSLVSRLETVRTRLLDASLRYSPGRYDGDLVLIRSGREDGMLRASIEGASTWPGTARETRVLCADCERPQPPGVLPPELLRLLVRELNRQAERSAVH